jgi:tRNA G18 (ribose-2'-O)-methylase SpoU
MKPETIEEPDDPRVADYGDLRDTRLRLERGVFIGEGRTVVRRLLASRFRVRSVLLAPGSLEALRDALESADPGLPVYVASPALLRRIVGFEFHRGCLAAVERGPEPAPEALIAPAGRRLLLGLEELADPDNVGGVFRNAWAFGADGVLLSPGSADPLGRKAIRASAGGALALPFARMPDWPAGLARVREAGYTLIALTPDAGALDLGELGQARPVPARLALLLGTEGRGLSPGARAQADLTVGIPMAPGVDSLNVATAAGIVLHHLARVLPGPAGKPRAPQG